MGKKAGRPSVYSEKLALEICTRLAMGESLRKICESDAMPNRYTVLSWAVDLKHPFYHQYESAREKQAESLADELMDIADDGSNDWMERKMRDGSLEEVVNHEHIQRSRLRVDTRKWIASKLKPKRYGDKQTVAHEGLSLEELVAGPVEKKE